VLRGFTAVAFGVLALISPYRTVRALVMLFGLYAVLHGVLSVVSAISSRGEGGGRRLLTYEGIISIVAGVVTLRAPYLTALVLMFVVCAWAIVTGILRIAEAARLRRSIPGELWLALSGVATVLFGLILILGPVVGKIGVGWMIGIYALLLGLFEILLGYELRALPRGRPLPAGA
jgi:uncharacterized membrane protein HdeD (DUF308 family)